MFSNLKSTPSNAFLRSGSTILYFYYDFFNSRVRLVYRKFP